MGIKQNMQIEVHFACIYSAFLISIQPFRAQTRLLIRYWPLAILRWQSLKSLQSHCVQRPTDLPNRALEHNWLLQEIG